MTVKSLTLRQQTRLAITILIEDDTGTLAMSLVLVTGLMWWLWQTGQTIAGLYRRLAGWAQDFYEAITFTYKVTSIWVTALAYGLGVTR